MAHNDTPDKSTDRKSAKSRPQLSDLIHIRCTTDEKEQIRQTAEVAGMSISQYARRRLLGHRIQSRLELSVLAEMRKQGGLLKHLITLTTQGGSVDANEIRQTLHKLENVYENIRRSMHQGRE